MNKLIENLKDWWITWRTGKDAQTRAWDKWRTETINFRANTIQEYFKNFKYVIRVDERKIVAFDGPFGWEYDKGFYQFTYPLRELGDNAVSYIARGYETYTGDFDISGFGIEERIYVATNNDEDAIMIALKFS